MSLLKVLIILIVVVLAWFPLKAKFLNGHAGAVHSSEALADIAQNGIRGSYVMEGATWGQPRLSLRFIDKQRVQMLGDGKAWGKNDGICTYKINGDKLDLTHACGVWHMEIKGEVLHQSNEKLRFRLSK